MKLWEQPGAAARDGRTATIGRPVEETTGGIFISYRRSQTAHVAGRLADRLRQHFGPDNVFVDIDSIPPGTEFLSLLEDSVASSAAVVVLIGPNWADLPGPDGRPRIFEPSDVIAAEIATALERGVPVIPVTVDGARMPTPSQLPPPLMGISRRNAIPIDAESFNHQVDRLIQHLEDTSVPPANTDIPIPNRAQLRRRWREIGRGERREIDKAVRKGRTVDPDKAALAAARARQQRRSNTWVVGTLVAFLVWFLAAGSVEGAGAVFAVVGGLSVLIMGNVYERRRADRAEKANLEAARRHSHRRRP
jgi:hypothetical protein